jgi:hypothetical protein
MLLLLLLLLQLLGQLLLLTAPWQVGVLRAARRQLRDRPATSCSCDLRGSLLQREKEEQATHTPTLKRHQQQSCALKRSGATESDVLLRPLSAAWHH